MPAKFTTYAESLPDLVEALVELYAEQRAEGTKWADKERIRKEYRMTERERVRRVYTAYGKAGAYSHAAKLLEDTLAHLAEAEAPSS